MKLCICTLAACTALAMAGPQVVNSFDAPDTDITGLAYASGDLYVLSSSSKTVYRVDTDDGTVLGSFSISPGNANGLGYAGSSLYVTNGTSNVYEYTLGGSSQGTTSLYCPG